MGESDRRYPVSAFDYPLPEDLIAQHPLPDRSASRLLVLHKSDGRIEHRSFRDFPSLIEPGDVVVVNASRVIPARLKGTRENGREAEILLVHPEPDGSWLAMVHPGGKLKPGRKVRFGRDAVAEVVEVLGGGMRRIKFCGAIDVRALMERYGSVPLPPYIRRPPEEADRERYQTIFARVEGSVAAPTAGLHFTPETVSAIEDRGGKIVEIVLHIGPGTFKPVEVDDPSRHVMHAEWYEIPEAAAEEINRAKIEGSRIWAIGTTAVRTLETAAVEDNPAVGDRRAAGVRSGSGWTDLFIYPPYEFKVVDALLTNFHLPRSTLLMLVAAFGGYERTMAAYREAVALRYRMYSYGDAMAIL
ncbi:MAG: S-adenosylmethionine:tRNA ribosyltransferase-isomerase [Gemmatimonadales bacterium]|nr:S-adenosylmethionine:tRNA ribosyltransferase-isomerase [bacterium HR33]GIW51892.1 MAG: S-adenosylmethionine:tRNA ribosyltransferase-isomerase [Gemmatimonadales bacterium]